VLADGDQDGLARSLFSEQLLSPLCIGELRAEFKIKKMINCHWFGNADLETPVLNLGMKWE
jgi:hypothetical protein